MSDLGLALRKKLEKQFFVTGLSLLEVLTSADETQKFLFRTLDGNFIEAVSIPMQGHVTACLSTQAGCRFACHFCASGQAGFKRNLSSLEIIDQLILLKNRSLSRTVTHVVFMGTGEPLDNYDNLLKAIRTINSAAGFNIGARRITVSTCGIIPAIAQLAKEGLQIELSVSLHAADNRLRAQIMPVARRYRLNDLMKALAGYQRATGRQITFEYIMIKNFNSDLQSARDLSTIVKGLDCKVNLIPANPVRQLQIEPPGKVEFISFKEYLVKHGVHVTVRKSRGQDIDAACGQLRLKYEKK
jgi:23S rRNA (adenine2503-C2)-methyltransferase